MGHAEVTKMLPNEGGPQFQTWYENEFSLCRLDQDENVSGHLVKRLYIIFFNPVSSVEANCHAIFYLSPKYSLSCIKAT